MKYRRSDHFKQAYQNLPAAIQDKAKKAFRLFQEDPRHPSLVVKKIKGTADIWEGRVDQQYRFTFQYEKDTDSGERVVVFRNIDNHDECLKNP
jgi:mRNA interferase RelE/StbE